MKQSSIDFTKALQNHFLHLYSVIQNVKNPHLQSVNYGFKSPKALTKHKTLVMQSLLLMTFKSQKNEKTHHVFFTSS